MNVFTTSNGIILGNKEGKKVVGIVINNSSNVTEDDFSKLALASMKCELQVVRVGKGDSFSERQLTDGEALSAAIVDLQLESAANQAEMYLIEKVFGELRGKR